MEYYSTIWNMKVSTDNKSVQKKVCNPLREVPVEVGGIKSGLSSKVILSYIVWCHKNWNDFGMELIEMFLSATDNS